MASLAPVMLLIVVIGRYSPIDMKMIIITQDCMTIATVVHLADHSWMEGGAPFLPTFTYVSGGRTILQMRVDAIGVHEDEGHHFWSG